MAGAHDTVDRETDSGAFAAVGDLVAATAYAVLAAAAIAAGAVDGALRVLVAAPLVGFLPGYAVVSALFPARGVAARDDPDTRWVRGPTWTQRASLSVATSLLVLVLAALAASLAGVPFATQPLAAVVAGVVVTGAVLGLWRRRRLPPDDRLVVPVAAVAGAVRGGTVDAAPPDAALNVALAAAVVVAASAVAVGLAAPDYGEPYSEAALLTQGDDGLVAANYTTAVERGDAANVTLSVTNSEGEPMDYTAVVVLERVDARDDGGAVVLERQELERVDVSLGDGETAQRDLAVEPTLLGEDLRLSVYVYEGDPPAFASADTAPHHLYLWLDVERAGGGQPADATAARQPVPGAA
ncbi:DUF1616 domain-containing protein [Halobacterium yunchengense]|uniref:DUF1616 domain-containing protein n=1 Tax=Halobacterium yunchengense TaxID=3108497 RepID=UPI00300B2FEB